MTISEEARVPGVLARSSFRRSAQGREIVLVLGMHRSGTSLLANILHLLGVDMVDKPTHTSSKNATGFWEREDLVAVQDAILETLGAPVGSPAHVAPFRPGWWRSVEIRPLKDKLRDMVAGQLQATRRPWGFKDPRTCRLLPLWGEILEELDVSPRFVWAIRHPAESARSMTAKNPERRPIPVPQSEVMWLAYNYDILRYTGRHWPLVVPYDAWFGDSLALAKEIAAELDLVWQGSDHELEAALASLISPEQRHHWSERGKLTCHLALSGEVYRSILVMRAEPQSSVSETLALSLQSLLGAVQPFAEQASDLKAAKEETQRLSAALEASQSALAEAQARIAVLEERSGRHIDNERILAERSETLMQKLTAARSERDAGQAEIVVLRERLDERERKLAASRRERDDLEQQLAGVTAERAALSKDHESLKAELTRASSTVEDVRSRLAAAEDYARNLKRQLEQRDQHISAEAAARERLEQQLAGLTAEHDKATASLAESEAARMALSGELEARTSELERALAKNEAFRSRLMEAEELSGKLRAEVSELAARLADESAARADAEGRNLALAGERQNLCDQIEALRGEQHVLETQLAELAASRAEASKLKGEMERMKADLAALRNTLRSERERFAEARMQRQDG